MLLDVCLIASFRTRGIGSRSTSRSDARAAGIRASEAPEAFQFRVDLAPGERLTELASGGVAVVRDGPTTTAGQISHDASEGTPDTDDPTTESTFEPLAEDEQPAATTTPVVEGKVVAEIAPTWAQDADGNPIPTDLEVVGDVVTLEVEHHGDETAYPVVADPVVTAARQSSTTSTSAGTTLPTWRSVYDWPAGNGYFTWNTATSATDAGAYSFARGLTAGPGLWLSPTGGRTYQPGFAEWNYTAPGTTRLLKSSIELAYNPRILSHHCVRAVLRTPAGERNSSTFCKPPAPPKGTPRS